MTICQQRLQTKTFRDPMKATFSTSLQTFCLFPECFHGQYFAMAGLMQAFKTRLGRRNSMIDKHMSNAAVAPQSMNARRLRSARSSDERTRCRPSLDHFCWRYLDARHTFRRVNESGRIIRVPGTASPSTSPRLRSWFAGAHRQLVSGRLPS